MTDWTRSVTIPSYTAAHQRRRKVTTEGLSVAPPADRELVVLSMALLAAGSADTVVVTVPVFDQDVWRAVTVACSPGSTVASARSSITDQLAGGPAATDPPPSSAVVVFGDGLVDPSHVALRSLDERLELTGPIEPIGGVSLLSRRVAWMIEQLTIVRRLGDIDPLAPAEQSATTLQRMGPALDGVRHVVSLFEQTARRTPHAPALTTPWTTLTYDELMGLAADRHALLRRRGVGPGDVVGLHLSRSSDLVATILAVWEARASFVPFTGNLPRARVLAMLEDAGATRVITDLGHWRSPGRTIETLGVERDIHERRTRRRREAPKSLLDAAYVLFTPQSDGRPVGIRVTHGNLAHYFGSIGSAMPGAGRRGAILASAPITFDASMLELIWPLTIGWEVILDPGHDVPIGPMARRRQVTHVNLTPTMASLMLHDRDGREVLETAEHIVLGGEPVRGELVRELRKVTRADFTVRDGPTEATVDVTWAPIDDHVVTGTVPVGRPLPGHSVDVVDQYDRSVGALSEGELVVLGDAVTSGHVGRAPRPSPFRKRGGMASFRTGDIVWSDVDGVIHHVGRRDRQVNVRGHRVELDEVDARLSDHPAVRDSATVAIGEADLRRLVSFVVAIENIDDSEFFRWMQDELPEPMIPAMFVRIASLPRSDAGEPDLEALRGLARTRARDVLPRRELSATEQRVAEIFETVLDVATVPPDCSFFELGGNSVTAVRLVSELEAVVAHRVRLATLLDVGSVEQIADAIDRRQLGSDTKTLVSIAEGDGGLPMYCVAGADGHAANLRPLGESLGREFHGLEFAGTDGMTPPDTSIESMADRFVAAITHHSRGRPVVLGGYAGGGLVALEMARRLRSAEVDVALLILIDSINPQLESRSITRKLIDGVRELGAPDELSPVGVLRNRFATEQLSRRDNLLSAARQSRVPSVVDLTFEFERAVADWEPPTYDGDVLVVRSAIAVPATRGWDRVATGRIDVVAVDSGHVQMMLPPDVDELARQLREVIAGIEGSYPG